MRFANSQFGIIAIEAQRGPREAQRSLEASFLHLFLKEGHTLCCIYCGLNIRISLGRGRFVVVIVVDVACDGLPASISIFRTHIACCILVNVRISLGRGRFVVVVVACDGLPASISAFRTRRFLHLLPLT